MASIDESSSRTSSDLASSAAVLKAELENVRLRVEAYRGEVEKEVEDQKVSLEEEKKAVQSELESLFSSLRGDLENAEEAFRTSLDENRTAFDENLDKRRSELDSFMQSLKESLASLDGRKAEIETQAEALRSGSDSVYGEFQTKVKELASTSESSLSSSLIEAENNLTKLSSELSLKFESASRTVFSEIDEARRQFEQSHDKQKALIQSEEENYVDKCREDLRTAMDSEVSRVSAIFDSMVQTSTEQLGNFTRKLTEIKEAVSMLNQGMSESLSRTSEKISQIQSRLTNSEASLSDTQNKVTIAKEELFNLQKEHKSLTDEVTRARKELDSLRLQAQNAKRERQDEEARLVKLQLESSRRNSEKPAPAAHKDIPEDEYMGEEEEIPLDEE